MTLPSSTSSSGSSNRLPADLNGIDPLTLAQLIQVDQERRWKSGERPIVEGYLGRYPILRENAAAVVALLFHEFRLREQSGEELQLDEFAARFPDHAEALRALLGLQNTIADARGSREGSAAVAPPTRRTVTPSPLPVAPVGTVEVPGYTIQGVLGRGGMGVVYKAQQTALRRTVALKMILHGDHADEDRLRRFQSEAEAIAQMAHPNIVQIYEVGQHGGAPYFSLEFCSGGSLEKQLDGTPWEPKRAAALVQVLAQAVDGAHRAGLVHRDLKPGNVLLTADRTPKITDFGLVKRLDAQGQTQSGALVGTPSYMAPEQAGSEAKRVGPAADVYALGAILYELLTGHPPFRAATIIETVYQVLHQEPVSVRRLQPKTPKDIETICHKCLEKEPNKRYASAQALAEDLLRYLAGEPVQARPAGPVERAVKWARRRPAVAGLLGGIFLVVVLGSGISTYFGLMAVDQARQANGARQTAEQALEKVEVALVDSYARPLGFDRGHINPGELDACWDLARSDNPHIRLLFFERVLSDPDVAVRVGRRAEMAVHAALGLDLDRRQQLAVLLLDRISRPGADARVCTACARFGLALHAEDPVFAVQASQALLQAMARDNHPSILAELGQGVAALAVHMPPQQRGTTCGRAAERLLELLLKESHPGLASELAEALQSLAAHMDPTTRTTVAARASGRLLEILVPPFFTHRLNDRLMGLTGWLNSVDASTVAVVAFDLMVKAPSVDIRERSVLPELIKALAGRMKAGEMVPELVPAATRALDAMPRRTYEDTALQLGNAIEAILARMPAEDARPLAAIAADRLLDVMKARPLQGFHDRAVDTLVTLTGFMTSQDARKTASRMVDIWTTMWSTHVGSFVTVSQMETIRANYVYPKAVALGKLVALLGERLGPEEAAAVAKEAAERATEAIKSPGRIGELGQVVAVLASRMKPPDGAALAAIAAGRAVDGIFSPTFDFGTVGLSRALQDLAQQMSPQDRDRVVARVIEATLKDPHLGSAAQGAQAVATLTGGRTTKEISQGLAKSASKAIEVIATGNQPPDVPGLLRWRVDSSIIGGFAVLMTPQDAAVTAEQALAAFGQAASPRAQAELGKVVAVLVERMPPKEAGAAKIARQILATMERQPGREPTIVLGGAVSLLADRMAPAEAANVAAQAINRVLDVSSRASGSFFWAQTAAEQLAKHLASAAAAATVMRVLSIADQEKEHLDRSLWGGVLVALTKRVTPHDAPLILRLLIDHRDPSKHPTPPGTYINPAFGSAMGELASRLTAQDAASAVDHALDVIPRQTNPAALPQLGKAVAMLASRLTPQDARKACRRALEALGGAIDLTTLVELEKTVAALAGSLPPEEASLLADRAMDRALDILGRQKGRADFGDMGNALETLAKQMMPQQAAGAAGQALDILARADDLAGVKELTMALTALASQSSLQGLVDVLKQPTCVGKPEEIIRQEFGRRAGQEFKDLWELVDWLRRQEQPLDLASPPHLPKS
jgi:hypothetical protein